MNISKRSTIVVPDRLAARAQRLRAARVKQHGLQILSIDQLAARLAGGFVRPIDADSLRMAVQAALAVTPMGELEPIKSLPGMVNAATTTLGKIWLAGINLQASANSHPRLAALAGLELAVIGELPTAMMLPTDIASNAMKRLANAPAVLGDVTVDGVDDIAPCWRDLLLALTGVVQVRWLSGARAVPGWVESSTFVVVRSAPEKPQVSVVSAATPAHEVLETMRWMRQLLASGQARAEEIGIGSADPSRFDAHMLAFRGECDIDLHFVHGVAVATTRDGQAASALAEILARGLSQARLRRLVSLCDREAPILRVLPERWMGVLPSEMAMTSPQSWTTLLNRLKANDWPDQVDHGVALRKLVDQLQLGPTGAQESGELFLRGRALAIWRSALVAGPAASLPATLEAMKQDDGLDPCACAAWMPASSLAGTPRRFVRLLGLNAGQWPRPASEDGLVPDHIIAARTLEPLSQSVEDSNNFHAVVNACPGQVVLSYSRRNDEGRTLGLSPLLPSAAQPIFLARHAIPVHAMSESDRLAARPSEFRMLPQAVAASTCWINWHLDAVTAHDGAVAPDHPLLRAIAERTHSASSLQQLLRNPLGYLWEYGFGWQAPLANDEPLLLDASANGSLIHEMLEAALNLLGKSGLATADAGRIAAAVAAARSVVADRWANMVQLPPAVIWQRTLDDACHLALAGLSVGQAEISDMDSFAEVAFGGSEAPVGSIQPWDAETPIVIPGTTLRIKGHIDRLDVSRDGKRAIVRDYKTGKAVGADVVISGGAELQRCLYAFAVTSMMPGLESVRTTLLYPRESIEFELDEPAAVMTALTGHLTSACISLAAGNCLPGPNTGSKYDKFSFLLPANALATYCKRKSLSVHASVGDAAHIWEAK